MAFWGTEVKPGKPFTHLPDHTRPRLHISQATLGFGTGETKSVVQCNVGKKSPVLLCSLFPGNAESCQLNLEFEEHDEVVFSVIGPQSVHLTGYFIGRNRKLDDESESYGEDIAGTDTEKSSDEDEYEDSFIDDGDLQNMSLSPISVDGAADETLHKRKKKNEKPKYRRLRKKYTDNECSSQQHKFGNGAKCTLVLDSESEDRTSISTLFKSAGRSRVLEAEEKAEERQADQYKSLQPSVELNSDDGAKPKKKMEKQRKEEKELETDGFFFGKFLKWETKADQSFKVMTLENGDAKRTENDRGENPLPSDEVVAGTVAKSVKRDKRKEKEEKVLVAESPINNVNEGDQAKPDDTKCENIDIDVKNDENNVSASYLQLPSVMEGHENGSKPKKKRKRAAAAEAERNQAKNVEEEKASQDEPDSILDKHANQSGSENQSRKKKKKKKSRTQENVDESMNVAKNREARR